MHAVQRSDTEQRRVNAVPKVNGGSKAGAMPPKLMTIILGLH